MSRLLFLCLVLPLFAHASPIEGWVGDPSIPARRERIAEIRRELDEVTVGKHRLDNRDAWASRLANIESHRAELVLRPGQPGEGYGRGEWGLLLEVEALISRPQGRLDNRFTARELREFAKAKIEQTLRPNDCGPGLHGTAL